jgi:hypothetical protein
MFTCLHVLERGRAAGRGPGRGGWFNLFSPNFDDLAVPVGSNCVTVRLMLLVPLVADTLRATPAARLSGVELLVPSGLKGLRGRNQVMFRPETGRRRPNASATIVP